MGLLDCAEDHRRGALDGPAHQVFWAVAVVYLGEPPFDRHGLAVRAGGHVAVRQNAGQDARCRVEFGTQDLRESAFAGFDDGAGVVCDQAAEHGVGVLGVAQVPGAVELVQAGGGETGCVAEPLLRGTTSSYDNALIRENSLYLSWLAEDYILLNEIDLAAEIATHVLELGSRANSARTDERLRHLASLLRRYKDVHAVAGFLDQYKDLSHRTPRR